MRLSEALHLEQADVELETVSSHGARDQVQEVASSTASCPAQLRLCHDTLKPASLSLGNQASERSSSRPVVGLLPHRTVHHTFDVLRRRLGWVARGGHPQPRIHDLRHTFICRALLRGQQQNQLDHVADAIATYVGHAKVSDTYWYVTAIPELMGIASERFSRFSSGECR